MKAFSISGKAQGTTYHITYYAVDSVIDQSSVDSLLNVLDHSLSLYQPNSLVNQFNASASGIEADEHLERVVKAAQQVFEKTKGMFDITIAPLTRVWGFGPVHSDSIPTAKTIRSLLPCVDSKLLYWEGRQLKKKIPCVQLDPNGIAQGYSVDQLALLLEAKGIKDYMVELGGEVRVAGRKWPEGIPMTIGIESPAEDFAPINIKKTVSIERGALTTSGNYRKYRESGGKKLSHLIDPHTGEPVDNELVSVTVYAADAMTADAYDNALMGMGLKRAMQFVRDQPRIAAFFIYRDKNGQLAETSSKIFRSLLRH